MPTLCNSSSSMLPSPAASSMPRLSRRRAVGALSLALLLTLTACTPTRPTPAPAALAQAARGSCSLDNAGPDDQAAISAVLRAEGEFVVAQNIELLMRLWDDDGRVVDAKNTPDEAEDDQNWAGRDAIRHRYVRTVFPGAPSAVQRIDPQINIDGDRAEVLAAVRISGGEISGGDRWELIKRDGCWLLLSLTYNLEVAP